MKDLSPATFNHVSTSILAAVSSAKSVEAIQFGLRGEPVQLEALRDLTLGKVPEEPADTLARRRQTLGTVELLRMSVSGHLSSPQDLEPVQHGASFTGRSRPQMGCSPDADSTPEGQSLCNRTAVMRRRR